MKKWERSQVMRLTFGLIIGTAAGAILGFLLHKMGLFLPLGGIIGMSAAVLRKKK